MDFCCNVCGNSEVRAEVERGDGHLVLFCADCGMGVIDDPPASTEAFYTDSYYNQPDAHQPGYSNYAASAEHGLLWTRLLVEALSPSGGRVLDVGCADGFLLRNLVGPYERFGIEMNPAAAEAAAANGITIVARDIAEPQVTSGACGTFDIITSIATFEHLPDFAGGFDICLKLLKPTGVMLFEVPLISDQQDSTKWFHSSYEHIYYPTKSGMARLFQDHADYQFISFETDIKGYGSHFIGAGTRDPKQFALLQQLFLAMTQPELDGLDTAMIRLNLSFHVVYRFAPTPPRVWALPALLEVAASPNLLKRITELWHADSVNAEAARWHEQQAHNWHEAYDAIAAQAAVQAAKLELIELKPKPLLLARRAIRRLMGLPV